MGQAHGPPSITSHKKMVLVALDATPLAWLKDNLSALPNIRSLIETGQLWEPKSPSARFSACSWQTFASGMLPGEVGHYFPIRWDADRMKFVPVKQNELSFEPFWNDLDRRGVETIVFDAMSVPVAEDAPGIQIGDWNTQCNFAAVTNRPDILRHIKKTFGKKPIGDEVAVKKSRRTLAKLRDDLITSTRMKTEAILWLMKSFEWRCFITAYYEGHRAGHNLWPLWEDFSSDPPEGAMLDVYREIDTQIGRVLATLDLRETGFLLFSMHGMTPGFSQDHFLPKIIDRINDLYLKERGFEVPRRRRSLAYILRQTVPATVQLRIRELVGQTVQDWLIDREWRGGKDWKATPAFPMPGGGDVGFVRLSIEGREREGFLPAAKEDREDYVGFLCEALRRLRVKQTGEALIKEIVFAEDEFPGPRSHWLPDLLLVWQPDAPATEIWSEQLGTFAGELKTGRGGNHTGDSFAVLAGALCGANHLPPLTNVRDYKPLVEEFFAQA
jgi:predicted AlkP superfamily phosphohydrolase/phosphomutase